MCAWWYVVIGLAALIVIGAVLWIVGCYGNGMSSVYVETVGIFICVFSALLEIIVFIPTLTLFINAKQKIREFHYIKEYVVEVVTNGDSLENIAISNTIIEKNQWLAEAKASVDSWGVWSHYYFTDVMELEPITIKK